MRKTYVWRDGKWRDDVAPEPRARRPIVGEGDQRGFSFQLPLGYAHAGNHIPETKGALEAGTPYWTTSSQGEDIAKRAQDNGDCLQWERTRVKRPKSLDK